MSATDRYFSVPRKKTIRASEDWWAEPRERLDVIVTDESPINTGLVDQYENPIMRTVQRGPLGFCR